MYQVFLQNIGLSPCPFLEGGPMPVVRVFSASLVGELLGIPCPDQKPPEASSENCLVVFLPASIRTLSALGNSSLPFACPDDGWEPERQPDRGGYWETMFPFPATERRSLSRQYRGIFPRWKRGIMLIDALALALYYKVNGKPLVSGNMCIRYNEQGSLYRNYAGIVWKDNSYTLYRYCDQRPSINVIASICKPTA